MLDGRVLEASQVEYKPFPPLQREVAGMQGFPALNFPPRFDSKIAPWLILVAAILQQNCAPLAWHRSLWARLPGIEAKPLNPHSPLLACAICAISYTPSRCAAPACVDASVRRMLHGFCMFAWFLHGFCMVFA